MPKKPPSFRIPLACLPPYPVEGTMASRILDFIEDNPGCSANAVIKHLDSNPSPTKKCLRALVRRKVVKDTMDAAGHHHYTALPIK